MRQRCRVLDTGDMNARLVSRLKVAVLAVLVLSTSLAVGSRPATGDGGHPDPVVRQHTAAIASGGGHSCVITTEQTVKCWGYNSSGELGAGHTRSIGDAAGEMGEDLPVVDLGAGRTAHFVDAGVQHSCALLDDATVKCWGGNSSGQLGISGGSGRRGDVPGQMGDALPRVPLGDRVIEIAAGGAHTCALLEGGEVKCWGSNLQGQLGSPSLVTTAPGVVATLSPIDLGTGRTATAITAGSAHTCALLDSNAVKCWGANASGQLGIGTTESMGDDADEMGDSLPTVAFGGVTQIKAISAGDDFTCAVLVAGGVKCWGLNDAGQLGQGATTSVGDQPGEIAATAPVFLGSGRQAVAVSAGESHACALFDDGGARCWGRNIYGNLGLGDADNRGQQAGEMAGLTDVNIPGAGTAVAMATGDETSCFLLASQRVVCIGAGFSGQLGNGQNGNVGDQPTEVGAAVPLVDLGAGAGGLVGPAAMPSPPSATLDAAGRFVPLPPVRVFDTRADETPPGPKGTVGPDGSIDVQITGVGGVPANAIAVVMNVTATNTQAASFVTAYPAGTSRPVASSLNIGRPGQTRANLVTVPVGAGGRVSLYSLAPADLIGDVAGYYVDQDVAVARGRFVALTPQRIFDTRPGEPAPGPKGTLAAGESIDVKVLGVGDVPSSGVAAVVINITGTESAAAGFLTAYPSGDDVPGTSTVNLSAAGATAANLAIVPVGDNGSIAIFSLNGAHALGDVTGYITDATASAVETGLLVPVAPFRVFDSRSEEPTPGPKGFVTSGGSIDTFVASVGAIPAAVSGVVLNVTGVNGPPGFVSAWPTGSPLPNASTVNFSEVPIDTRANGAWLPVGVGGKVSYYTLNGSHILADASGYFLM